MTSRLLESIPGDLLAYEELEPDSMQHGYEITAERRTGTNEKVRAELRNNPFYTADGQLYTAKKKDVLLGITKLPQNLVLRNIDEAYRQLKETGNYFPPTEAAEASFRHADTVVVDLKGLELVRDNDEYGHFEINPTKIRKLNSQQKKAAMRLFGPDKESFGLNMEMLAEAGKLPFIFALMSDYVQRTLKAQNTQYLGRASWLNSLNSVSNFDADYLRYVDCHVRVRGVRRASEAFRQESHERSDSTSQREEKSPAGRAPENAEVPRAPSVPQEIKLPGLEDILQYAAPFVADKSKPEFEQGFRNLYKP